MRSLEQAIASVRIDGDDLPDISVTEIASIERAKGALVEHVRNSRNSAIRTALLAIDLKVEVSRDQIGSSCCRQRLLKHLDGTIDWSKVTGRVALSIDVTAYHNGQELRLKIDPPPGEVASVNEQLVALIIRAHAARDLLLAEGQGVSTDRKRELLRTARAAYLAPDIITAIFEARQPRSLTVRLVDRISKMPLDWREQRRTFGFD